MNNTGTRRCSYFLCMCRSCPNVPRVKRVKNIDINGRLMSMTPHQYMQYAEARQARIWLEQEQA